MRSCAARVIVSVESETVAIEGAVETGAISVDVVPVTAGAVRIETGVRAGSAMTGTIWLLGFGLVYSSLAVCTVFKS